ncbi:MAG: hypothetical protein H6Q14_3033 [Bacteroidetes bacterium]|nr:hypothetical protein [Bacteroidota bacterium]
MEQRKILNRQTEVRPLHKQGEPIDVENGKPAYLSPQVNVHYVALESTIASSISGESSPSVEDWTTVDPDTSDSGDLSL